MKIIIKKDIMSSYGAPISSSKREIDLLVDYNEEIAFDTLSSPRIVHLSPKDFRFHLKEKNIEIVVD